MNTLDSKFKHKRWFLNSNLTNRQVIEYFAKNMGEQGNNDFYFVEHSSGIVVKGLEDGSSWKPNKEQLNYLKKRIEFYKEYFKSHKGKYDFKNNWSNAMDQKKQDMIDEIPEYKSFCEDFKKSLDDKNIYYNGLAVFKKINEKPFIVSVSSEVEKNEVANSLERVKEHYKGTDIQILTTWIEKTKREDEIEKNSLYKRVCQNYVKTMLSQKIIENYKRNSIIYVFLLDSAIDLNRKEKITLDNYKNYLIDSKSFYEYKSYEELYNCFVKDFIKQDIQDLGLFNGKDNEWDFYISYNDMKMLGFEKIIYQQMENNELFELSTEEEIEDEL